MVENASKSLGTFFVWVREPVGALERAHDGFLVLVAELSAGEEAGELAREVVRDDGMVALRGRGGRRFGRVRFFRGEEFVDGDAEVVGEALVHPVLLRMALAGFVAAVGGPGDAEGIGRFLLGHALLAPQHEEFFVEFHAGSLPFVRLSDGS